MFEKVSVAITEVLEDKKSFNHLQRKYVLMV